MDSLLRVYREQLGSWGTYLTNRGLVHVPSLGRLLRAMGDMEEDVFALRAEEAAKFEKKKKRFDRRAPAAEDDEDTGDESTLKLTEAARQASADADMLAAAASRLKLEREGDGPDAGSGEPETAVAEPEEDEGGAFIETRVIDRRLETAPVDHLNYKARYYWEKFGITYKRGIAADDAVLRQVVHSFIEALQWVMLYYFRGCPSW